MVLMLVKVDTLIGHETILASKSTVIDEFV